MTPDQANLEFALFYLKENRLGCPCGHPRSVHSGAGCFWTSTDNTEYCDCELWENNDTVDAIEERDRLQGLVR